MATGATILVSPLREKMSLTPIGIEGAQNECGDHYTLKCQSKIKRQGKTTMRHFFKRASMLYSNFTQSITIFSSGVRRSESRKEF
jgi:hypothetical protein